jgi:hypothetical protein
MISSVAVLYERRIYPTDGHRPPLQSMAKLALDES